MQIVAKLEDNALNAEDFVAWAQNCNISNDNLIYIMNDMPGVSIDIRNSIYESNKKRIAEIESNSACALFSYQEKETEQVKKLRKF